MSGKRDPFISPVVNHTGGSGCSTGKKCLEIGAINLRGVVHSDGGFIAVVTNSLNKAYFLRENDPVFDGYVVKITGDSIVFKETLQDRLGKTFTREVVEKDHDPGRIGRSLSSKKYREAKAPPMGRYEMRKQLLGLILPLLAFVLIAAAADMPGKGVAAASALQRLEVAHSQDGLRVEFTAKGAVAPKVTTLDSPARIVVDLPNTVMATGQHQISVGSDGVKTVRIGMNGQVPPTTRVVVDLDGAHQPELVAGKDGHFTLKIQGATIAKHTAAPVAQPVAASPAPKLVPAAATTVDDAQRPPSLSRQRMLP